MCFTYWVTSDQSDSSWSSLRVCFAFTSRYIYPDICICEYSCDFFMLIVASAQRVLNLLPIISQLSWALSLSVAVHFLISFRKSLFVLWVQPVLVLNIKYAFVTVCWVCKLSLKFQLELQVISRSTAISVFARDSHKLAFKYDLLLICLTRPVYFFLNIFLFYLSS